MTLGLGVALLAHALEKGVAKHTIRLGRSIESLDACLKALWLDEARCNYFNSFLKSIFVINSFSLRQTGGQYWLIKFKYNRHIAMLRQQEGVVAIQTRQTHVNSRIGRVP